MAPLASRCWLCTNWHAANHGNGSHWQSAARVQSLPGRKLRLNLNRNRSFTHSFRIRFELQA
jgi:hypothetical protein